VQHLAVRAVGGGGAIGMEDEFPAVPVDADVVVKLTQQNARGGGGFPAVCFVPQVMHVAPGGRPAAPRPGAALVAEQDGPADVGGDVVGVALVGILHL
jgi:hypothetical protein